MEHAPEPEFRIGDYVKILKRRYLFLVIPFILLFSGSVGVATLLPPIYVSKGTILIESPQISQEIVAGSIDSAARERIEVIKQRVMTRANLLRIANEFGVFREEKERPSSSQIVQKMRASTGVSFISGGGGYGGASTIAFTVSFEHRRGDVAARVASEVVTLFMDENVRTRTQIANETTDFLNQEARKLEKHLSEIETKIAEYKQENSTALPDNLDIRMGMKERAERQIQEADREIKAHQEELRFLDIQLSAYRSGFGTPALVDPEFIEEPSLLDFAAEEGELPPLDELADPELMELQKGLDEALVKYSPSHPDVKALKRMIDVREKALVEDETTPGIVYRIRKLEAQAENPDNSDRVAEINGEIETLRSELRATLIDGTGTDKRVLSLEQKRADVERRRTELQRRQVAAQRQRAEAEQQLNIENVETKMGIAQERIESLRAEKQSLQDRLDEIETTILQTPLVDRALKSLNRDYENAQQKYNEVRAKAMQAQIAENVEEASKAERFVLLEPPTVPDSPIKPNRKKLLMLGFALSFGAGVAGIVGIEFIDGSIRGAGQLENALSIVPLATIPYIITAKEQRTKARMRYGLALAVVVFGAAAIGGLHTFYKPIDEVIYKVIDRFT